MSASTSKRGVKGTLYHKQNEVSKSTTRDIQSTAQVQNVPSAKVYVFGDADVADEELLNDGQEAYELRPRGKSRPPDRPTQKQKEPVTIERAIERGDTLSKIAVKYCCEVADLKRVNNLISDQDFFGLASIKVPVQQHSLIQQRLEEEVRETVEDAEAGPSRGRASGMNGSVRGFSINGGFESPLSDTEEWGALSGLSDEDCDARQKLLVRTVSLPTAHSKGGKEAENFLKQMDKDIKDILTSTSSKKKNLEEVRTSLTCRRIYPLKRRESILGADCGIRLGVVITALVIVALLMPLLYFLYFEFIKPGHPRDTTTVAADHS